MVIRVLVRRSAPFLPGQWPKQRVLRPWPFVGTEADPRQHLTQARFIGFKVVALHPPQKLRRRGSTFGKRNQIQQELLEREHLVRSLSLRLYRQFTQRHSGRLMEMTP